MVKAGDCHCAWPCQGSRVCPAIIAGVGQPLQQQLRTYTINIVQQSWPAQRRGLANDQEHVLLTQFQDELLHTEVSSLSQQVLHGQAIETFNKLVELRR